MKVEWIDNPYTTYAQTIYEAERGAVAPGRIMATVNQRTLMGGFCRFGQRRRLPPEHLCKAAAKFRTIWERSQLGGARAIDPAIEAVDGGRGNFSPLDSGLDARQELKVVKNLLGAIDYRRLEYVVIRDHFPQSYARWRQWGQHPNKAAIERGKVEMWQIIDRLSLHWQYR